MEQILRRKFIVISVSVVFVVLLTMALVINATSFAQIDDTANQIIDVLVENDGLFPMQFSQHPQMLSQETPYSTRFFTVKVSGENALISVDTRSIQAIGSDQAVEYAQAVLNTDYPFSFVDNFKYEVAETDYGSLIIFIDCAQDLSLFHSSLQASVLMCAVALLGVFLLVLILSRQAVSPIVESYRKQQQFITNISHELKTPLAIMKTSTEVIEMEQGESQWCDSIHGQIDRLNGLVNYLVSLSKMDEDGAKPLRTDFSLSDAVEETAQSFLPLAQSAGAVLDIAVEENLTYNGEEQSIRLLLSILLENAVKYTNSKEPISLTLGKHKEHLILEVTNSADNLTARDYSILFERFYRLDDSRNSSTGGFGIGLAIAKTIVRNHGGDIRAESRDGQRLTLHVTL